MVSSTCVFNCDIDFNIIAKTKDGYCLSGNSYFTTFFIELEYGF